MDEKIHRKKMPENFASCAMRNDAVFRHFFLMDFFIHKQKIEFIP
jgi:hypothetical protein